MVNRPHKALLAAVLKNLGHAVPSEEELDQALKSAFVELKQAEGIDPNSVKFKISLIPVECE